MPAVLAIAGAGLRRALDLVLPPRCLSCGATVERQGHLCPGCWRDLVFIAPPLCRACGYPLPHAAAESPLCPACAREQPLYDRARAALRYDEASRRLILAFKHADRTDVAPGFADWLLSGGADLLADADLIAPVPLHRFRLLRRGYNQAAILARGVAKRTGLRHVPDLLVRTRATRSQQGLSGTARLTNITAAAFRLHPWRPRREVEGKRILLVDDVLTTGATVTACAQVLKARGALAVDVLALARVVRDAAAPIS